MPDGLAPPQFPLHVLSEYALLADGERGILVGPRGDFVWMCAPRWDSDAVFSSLIGGKGVYAVTPAASSFVWGGHYEPGTLIWHSRWVTTSQVIKCREALARPGDPHTAVALRRILAVDGQTRVHVLLDPHAGFGARPLRDLRRQDRDLDRAMRPAVPALVGCGQGRAAAGRRAAHADHRARWRPSRSGAGDLRPAARRASTGTSPGLGRDGCGLGPGRAGAVRHHR